MDAMAEKTKKEVSLLLEARDLLKVTPSGARRDFLRQATDQLQECYDLIKVSCTRTALRNLIGSATVLCVCIDKLTAPPDNPPKSDAARETRYDEAVAPDRMTA
jgi:hypothetical protein